MQRYDELYYITRALYCVYICVCVCECVCVCTCVLYSYLISKTEYLTPIQYVIAHRTYDTCTDVIEYYIIIIRV